MLWHKPTNLHASLFEQALQQFPGGVNSPVRSFGSVGGTPLFFRSGRGSTLKGVDGTTSIDIVQSWGAHILGHRPPAVQRAVRQQLRRLWSAGAPTEPENLLGALIREAIPSIESLRFTSSGTEACMSALRLARGYTGRSKIIKFDGCYHGHSDALLVQAGSGAALLPHSDTPAIHAASSGVPEAALQDTISLPYQDIAAVEQAFHDNPQDIAAVIIEPIAANMGLIESDPSFLAALRHITAQNKTVLIFDEVVSGFRFTYGGVQQLIGITPDITVLGKIIGGGLPCGAFGGSTDIMHHLAPCGPVYQAGTLSGNPLAMTAGAAVLTKLRPQQPQDADSGQGAVYQRLEQRCESFFTELSLLARNAGCSLSHKGGAFTLFCRPQPPINFADAQQCSTERYSQLFHSLLAQGIYTTPAQFEVQFIPACIRPRQLKRMLRAYRTALREITPGSTS